MYGVATAEHARHCQGDMAFHRFVAFERCRLAGIAGPSGRGTGWGMRSFFTRPRSRACLSTPRPHVSWAAVLEEGRLSLLWWIMPSFDARVGRIDAQPPAASAECAPSRLADADLMTT